MSIHVAITGCGAVTAAGGLVADLWEAVENDRSALRRLTLFESPRCGHALVGEVTGDPAAHSGLGGGSRTDHLAVWAARQAFQAAGLSDVVKERPERVGVVLGTTTGGMIDAEVFLERLMAAGTLDVRQLKYHLCANPCNAISAALGIRGPRATVSDACASGASAIATACEMLLACEADVILAGGADSLTRLTVNGFMSLLNVDPNGCKPFDAERKGMSLGEGAGVLVLEREEHARRRNAEIEGFVSGWGGSCDAYHATRPSPDGAGAVSAMKIALDQAGISPGDVDYINAHGTGTRENDASEARAIKDLFEKRVPPVSSTKGYIGHTLAAAGAIEAVICVEAIKHGLVPGNVGFTTADPELGLTPVRKTTESTLRITITNSLGFGGTNASLVIEGGRQ